METRFNTKAEGKSEVPYCILVWGALSEWSKFCPFTDFNAFTSYWF